MMAAVVSSAVGLASAAVLLLFFIAGRVTRISGRATLLAASVSFLWQSAELLASVYPSEIGQSCAMVMEVLTFALWSGVCLRVLGIGWTSQSRGAGDFRVPLLYATAAVAVGGVSISAAWAIAELFADPRADVLRTATFVAALLVATCGLVLVEQLGRNTRQTQHWNLKYLTIGLGVLFGFGFVTYADAVLFRGLDRGLSAAGGSVFAFVTPFLMVATVRNRDRHLGVNVSRRVVFHTGALFLTGCYLLLAGLGGYWVRTFGGSWGQVVAVVFVTASIVAAIVVAASRSVREKLARAVARNLFEQKHDYRDAWGKITSSLSGDSEEPLAQRAVAALGELIHAHRGAAWRVADSGILLPIADLQTGWKEPFPLAESQHLIAHFEETRTVLTGRDDLGGYGPGAEHVSRVLAGLPGAEVFVPLLLGDRLWGIVALTSPSTGEALDWEDEEILDVAGRQVASYLAQQYAERALAEARQLTALNQTTAFVVHDLKTVVSQLALLVENAAERAQNPEFVSDMIETARHAVSRMRTLLSHLRASARAPSEASSVIDLEALASEVVARRSSQTPAPRLVVHARPLRVLADQNKLDSALEYLIRNAQEATSRNGHVSVELGRRGSWIEVTIEDDGAGMDEAFVAEKLFTPFESTKGLTGMGIGSWQAREYIRRFGGDVLVESEPGRGTRFTILLPCEAEQSVPPPRSAAQGD